MLKSLQFTSSSSLIRLQFKQQGVGFGESNLSRRWLWISAMEDDKTSSRVLGPMVYLNLSFPVLGCVY
ncbi:hypothetical protein HanXRQr2_Chr13g0569931 [Helianthus annuus]|uniref:Uncharacterized protein n=1 Tax=Helianthus annuus TaxID=4232 RepID=A0A251SNB1_HELAN|nr:hypothetical protein HanXRQr2_Chr13g0569931 [Helianthus annuus]